MSCASHHGRVSPLVGAVVCLIALFTACIPALAEGNAPGVNARPDGWLINYGQSSITVPDTYHAHFARGQELMLAQDYEGAAGELLTCIRLFAPFTSGQQQRGAYADRVISETYITPLATASVNLGHCLQELGRLDTAIRLYTGAADIAPGYVPAHCALGQAQVEKGWAVHQEQLAKHTGAGDVRAGESELGLYRSAVAHLHVARQLDPTNVDVRLALAAGLRHWGVLDGALVHARKAVELEPTNPRAHYELGLAFAAIGQLTPAVDAFKATLGASKGETDAFQADVNDALATALAGRGNFDDAVAAYRKAAGLAPTNAVYQNNLAAALRSGGKSGEAATLHRAATALDPGSIEYYLNLATASRDVNDLGSAVVAYQSALRLDSKDPEIHHQLGVTLWQRSNLAAAIERCAGLKPDALTNDDVEAALAGVAMHFMRKQRVTRVDAMDPRVYDVTPRLAMTPNPWPELDHQMDKLWNALDEEPLYGTARLDIQDALADTAKVEQVVLKSINGADTVLQLKAGGEVAAMPLSGLGSSAAAIPAEVKAAVMVVATSLQRGDDLDEAIAELRWAFSHKSKCALIANNLGKALYDAGHVSEALSYYNKALALSADLAETWFNKGVALASLTRMDEAVAAWQHALDLGMEDPRLYTYLGIAHIQDTELDYAAAMLNKALYLKKDCAPASYYSGLVSALTHCASPLTNSPLKSSRLATKVGDPSYDIRAEFITDDELAVAKQALAAVDATDPDLKGMYYYVGVELALQDPALATVKGADVIHAVARGRGLKADWAAVCNNLAVANALDGKLPRAEELLRLAVRDEADYALAHWNLGRVLMLAGKDGEAKAELWKGAELAKMQGLDYYFKAEQPAPVQFTAPAPRPARMPREAAASATKGLLEAFDIPCPVL